MFDVISIKEGSYGTVWGACTGAGSMRCECPQCEQANIIEDAGLDYDEEYEKARLRNFDKVI